MTWQAPAGRPFHVDDRASAPARGRRAADREQRAATRDREHDHVAEEAETTLEYERVRRCLDGLTGLQRQSISLAFYSGYTYREVAELLKVSINTVKTRMRERVHTRSGGSRRLAGR